jgi:Mg/Co/Ni transporter MgtE
MTYEDKRTDVYVEQEGTSVGTILGIILAIIVVLAIIWFFFLGGLGNNPNNTNPGNDTTNQTQIEQPAPVDPGY